MPVWMDAAARIAIALHAMMPPRQAFKVERLSDEFGQYSVLLECTSCGHTRRCSPNTLAGFATWDAFASEVSYARFPEIPEGKSISEWSQFKLTCLGHDLPSIVLIDPQDNLDGGQLYIAKPLSLDTLAKGSRA